MLLSAASFPLLFIPSLIHGKLASGPTFLLRLFFYRLTASILSNLMAFFFHPNSQCQRYVPTRLGVLGSPSLLGPLNLPLYFSLAPAPRSNSCCGNMGPKDCRSIGDSATSRFFDISSMAWFVYYVDFSLGKREQTGIIQAWHKFRVGKICAGSGERGMTPK